jgi:hypothetical protein
MESSPVCPPVQVSTARNTLEAAAGVAGVVLLARGAVRLILLGTSLLRGTFDADTPLVFLFIEPWFVVGGFAYAGMALTSS